MAEYTVDVWGTGMWTGTVEADSEEEAREKATECATMEGGEIEQVETVLIVGL